MKFQDTSQLRKLSNAKQVRWVRRLTFSTNDVSLVTFNPELTVAYAFTTDSIVCFYLLCLSDPSGYFQEIFRSNVDWI